MHSKISIFCCYWVVAIAWCLALLLYLCYQIRPVESFTGRFNNYGCIFECMLLFCFSYDDGHLLSGTTPLFTLLFCLQVLFTGLLVYKRRVFLNIDVVKAYLCVPELKLWTKWLWYGYLFLLSVRCMAALFVAFCVGGFYLSISWA